MCEMNNDLEKEFEIVPLIVRSLQDELSEAEEVILNEWLEKSPENRSFYIKLQHRDLQGKREQIQGLHKAKQWKRIRREITPTRVYRWKQVARYAALLVLCLSAALSTLLISRNQVLNSPQVVSEKVSVTPGGSKACLITESGEQIELVANKSFMLKQEHGMVINAANNMLKVELSDSTAAVDSYKTIAVPIGGEYRLELSDGTVVWLNSDTRLRFPMYFGKGKRVVYLDGEACFDVAHDASSPFIVSMGGVDVRVLGTLFNVKAYASDPVIYTTLAQGAVKAINRQKNQTMVLVPNQQCLFHKDNLSMEVKKVDASVYLGWTKGHFVFENETLEEIMKQLERWYDVSVFYRNPEVKQYRFTGDIDRFDNISTILEMIQVTYNVRFMIKNKTITVSLGE